MSLALAGEIDARQERVARLLYAPGLQSSGDLEPGTKTVTATAKPGEADYTTTLTLPAPADARLSVKRVGLRLEVTIDSFGGSPAATRLNYAVHAGGVERLTGNWTATGAQVAGVVLDVAAGEITLGSGTAIAIYFWVDQGNAVISLVQVRLAVGLATGAGGLEYIRVTHQGFFQMTGYFQRVGTGTPTLYLLLSTNGVFSDAKLMASRTPGAMSDLPLGLSPDHFAFHISNSVGTDLAYIDTVQVLLRRLE